MILITYIQFDTISSYYIGKVDNSTNMPILCNKFFFIVYINSYLIEADIRVTLRLIRLLETNQTKRYW